MDSELLTQFREKVNEGERTLHILRNVDGKNKWNIICSAMDWLSIGLEGVDLKRVTYGNDNESSINALTFIMCADIIYESICQLHRVFIDNKTIPFSGDNSVFTEKRCSAKDDNEYFKIIRACFSSHAVNINSMFQEDKPDSKWYASWSGGIFSELDFSVILYPREAGKESKFFDISFGEIYKFAEKRYNYLNVLMLYVDKLVSEEDEKWKGIIISKPCDLLDEIHSLIQEQKLRFNNDWYDYELGEILLAFDTEITVPENLPVIVHYREKRLLELQEIRDYLQNMILAEKLNEEPNCSAPDSITMYHFAKLSGRVHGSEDCFPITAEIYKPYLSGYVNLDVIDSERELYVTVLAGFYMYHTEEKKNIMK